MPLRAGVESELLATVSSVLLCETLFQEEQSPEAWPQSHKVNETLFMKLWHTSLNVDWIAVPCKVEGIQVTKLTGSAHSVGEQLKTT